MGVPEDFGKGAYTYSSLTFLPETEFYKNEMVPYFRYGHSRVEYYLNVDLLGWHSVFRIFNFRIDLYRDSIQLLVDIKQFPKIQKQVFLINETLQ